jgi:hypothetical protein
VFGFVLTTQSDDAALTGHTFSGTLRLHVTGSTDPDPIYDADYFYIPECPTCAYVGVYAGRLRKGFLQCDGRELVVFLAVREV